MLNVKVRGLCDFVDIIVPKLTHLMHGDTPRYLLIEEFIEVSSLAH